MESDGDAVPYHELLGLARDEGLIALDVQVIQAPGEANGRSAVVQATARTREGGFTAVGEASAASAPPDWQPFLVTLAELRAKARALRELTGLEHAVREEFSTPYLPAYMPAQPDTGPGSRQQAPHTGAAGGRAFPNRPEGNGAASTPASHPTPPSTVSSPRGDAADAD